MRLAVPKSKIQVADADMHHPTGHDHIQGYIFHEGHTPSHVEISI